MPGLPLTLPRDPSSVSTPIPSANSIPSLGGPKSFGSKSLQRKRPVGLSIDKAIESSRHPQSSPGEADTKDGQGFGGSMLSEAEQLRQDIARLQLSSQSSGSVNTLDSLEGSSPAAPLTPTTLNQSDSSTGTTGEKVRKKGKDGAKKKAKVDKDGLELVKDEDLDILTDLGAGNGGSVTKVWNKKRGCVMARKLILVDAKPAVRKQILRELQIMNDCNSPYIVGYYGCFLVDVHVGVVMEYMDAGSLDYIYRKNGAIPIHFVGKVAESVLKGLMYLYDVHRIIHRDIKPSNILANTNGEIKICDFGVSGELINSIANTFVGTSTYMSPERIQGAPYTIKSDVWSLGISLIEIATARFPFQDPPDSDNPGSESEEEYDPDPTLPLATRRPNLDARGNEKKKKKGSKGVSLGGGGHTMSILDLLQHIVNEPAPTLVSRRRQFPEEAKMFVEGCLDKEPSMRKSPQELLASQWITASTVTREDLQHWAKGLRDDDA